MPSRLLKPAITGLLSVCLMLPVTALAARHKSTSAQALDTASVNEADWQENAKSVPLLIKLQVQLDRAHVSPGEIDGTFGENTQKAVAAFRQTRGLGEGDQLDDQLWRTLLEENSDAAAHDLPHQ